MKVGDGFGDDLAIGRLAGSDQGHYRVSGAVVITAAGGGVSIPRPGAVLDLACLQPVHRRRWDGAADAFQGHDSQTVAGQRLGLAAKFAIVAQLLLQRVHQVHSAEGARVFAGGYQGQDDFGRAASRGGGRSAVSRQIAQRSVAVFVPGSWILSPGDDS